MTLSNLPANIVPALVDLARETAAEGIVLLKNDHQVLPLPHGQKLSVFGRCQQDYYKSGTGSGGMVNAPYVVSILEGLRQSPHIVLNETLADVYTSWCRENPPEQHPEQWAADPWSQPEMPLIEDQIQQAAAFSDTALVVIGRTAGEDRDAANEEGSFWLSTGERDMLRAVTAAIPHVAVLLNVGNILDMSWEDDIPVDAILYVWHGGMEGGRAVTDVLTGEIPASGKLSDTIARSYTDYPSASHFGGDDEVTYAEDIYVGYRYFETFAPDRVRYPFGFGLSYTTFSLETTAQVQNNTVCVTATVTNTGNRAGKEVVQVYAGAPQGVLGKPARQLMGFAKTALLRPGERQTLTIRIAVEQMASYDDSGKTGHKSAYVLEPGDYTVYVGTCVRTAAPVLTIPQHSLRVVKQCEEALAPVHPFNRFIAATEKGHIRLAQEPVPTRQTDVSARIAARLPAAFSPVDSTPTFAQVCRGEASAEAFVAGLPLDDLAYLCRAEGMNSPKVTPGTAAAFGGLTPSLAAAGLPVACCADGPSGIRMDTGEAATSLPIGTLMACTWNTALIERLHRLEGQELLLNRVDCWLSPGMNIHRHPLCGRNFEYFSEDPLLTGMMASAVVRGVQSTGVCATPKHFAANNQEHRRHDADSRVSERALREIYLKGFEIVVKTARPAAIMTSYNLINGRHAANAYDLTTTILREEWHFSGMVMTDWWAKKEADGLLKEEAAMIRAQNDIAMPVGSDTAIVDAVQGGALVLAEVQRCARNIVRLLIDAPVSRHYRLGGQYGQGPDWFYVE